MGRRAAYLRVPVVAAILILAVACDSGASPTPLLSRAVQWPVPAAAPNTKAPEGATAASARSKAIKIGLITPLTGGAAGYGARQKVAAHLAVEDVNRAGHINGSPLELVMVDDAANPGDDLALVRRLASSDGVPAIVGPLTNASFETAAPLANELEVPLVTASATQPGIAGRNRPWVFSFSVPDSAIIGKAIQGYKKLHPNIRRMVITGTTREMASEDLVKNVYPTALKNAGLEVIGTVPFEPGTTDFSAVVARIKGLDPQGIALSSATPEAVSIAKEFQRQGVKAPVLASQQNWAGPEIVLAPQVIEGWVVGGAFDEETQDPRGKAYLERFVSMAEADPAVGMPAYPGLWTQTYDTITAIAEVMRNAQVNPEMELRKARQAIQEGIHSIKGFKGITGDISVLPNGEIAVAPSAFVARGGKWVSIR